MKFKYFMIFPCSGLLGFVLLSFVLGLAAEGCLTQTCGYSVVRLAKLRWSGFFWGFLGCLIGAIIGGALHYMLKEKHKPE